MGIVNEPPRDDPLRRRALLIAILVSGALLPALFAAGLVAAFVISAFYGSDTVGGPADGGEWWAGWGMLLALASPVAVAAFVGVRFYRRRTRQVGGRSPSG